MRRCTRRRLDHGGRAHRRRLLAVEHALARGNFGDRAVDAAATAGRIVRSAELIRIVACARRRVSSRPARAEPVDLAREIVEALVNGGERVVIVAVLVVALRLDAFLRRGIEDDGVQPFAQRHARPARSFFCCLANFRLYSFHTPRDTKFHSHTHGRGGGAKSLDRLSRNRRAMAETGAGRSLDPRPTLCRSG